MEQNKKEIEEEIFNNNQRRLDAKIKNGRTSTEWELRELERFLEWKRDLKRKGREKRGKKGLLLLLLDRGP